MKFANVFCEKTWLVATPLSIMFHADGSVGTQTILRKVHLLQIKNNSREFFNRFIHIKTSIPCIIRNQGPTFVSDKYNEPKVQASSAE